MNEKELQETQKQIAELMRNLEKDPKAALEKLQELQKFADQEMDQKSEEYISMMVAMQEAKGDCFRRLNQIPDAEKAYQEGVKGAVALFEADREKNDYRLGGTYYKLATFYRGIIGCHLLSPQPKQLPEQHKKIYELAEKCYKSAIGCTMENAKKGSGRHVEFHANCLEELSILHASVGDYEKAIPCGKDAVYLGKAVYEKKDDHVYAFRLANKMNGLAGMYMFTQKPQLAMEMLEDAVFVLEEHVEEDPITLGTMLARYYISLGSCYCAIEEEKENAEEAFKKGLDRMVELNDKSNNRLIDDVIQSYTFVGDYYRRVGKNFDANAHYTWAIKLATDMKKATQNEKYDALVKHLQGKLS